MAKTAKKQTKSAKKGRSTGLSTSAEKSTKSTKNSAERKMFVWKESYAGILLGAIIAITIGILVANYFNHSNIDKNVSEIKTETATPSSNGKEVTVVKGESLSIIAKRELGDAKLWPEIVKENDLKSTVVEPGQVLKMPASTASSEAKVSDNKMSASEATATPSPKDAAITAPTAGEKGSASMTAGGKYTAQAGETLWTISEKVYGSGFKWKLIANANKVRYNRLGHPIVWEGMNLSIPALR